MAKQGKTTGNLKMRSGPGLQFEPPIAYLVPDTALEILGEDGDWWQVRAAGKEGYVGKKYVAVTETPAAEEPAPKATEGLVKPEAPGAKLKTGMVKTGGAKPSTVKATTDGPAVGKPNVKPTPPKPAVGKPNVKPIVVKSSIKPNMPKPGRPRGGTDKR
jgi:hypothetical protein